MKYRLLAPGPTPVPERVLSLMSRSMIHHRTPAFESIFADCIQGLKWVLQTKEDVLLLSCSGTGAFEATFQNFFSAGDLVLNVTGGKFGERWGKMAERFGLKVHTIEVPWGKSANPEEVRQALEQYPECRAVICVASETSTGTRQPYEAIGRVVQQKADCLLIVDAISALGVWDISPERDHIDVLIASSQKALMLPPGLAFLAISPKAWEFNRTAQMPRFYFDLAQEKKAQACHQTAFTPAVSLIAGLQESLKMMKEEGLSAIFERHARVARATRAAIQALGLKLFSESPADSLTAIYTPKEIRPNGVYTGLQDRAKLTIAGGQGEWKGKIFRIAHLGYFDELDILTVLSALEIVLRQEGYEQFEPGCTLKAVYPILSEGFKI
ncbi:MAG: alanine--glyoxylate aminotransferase family protein [Myxococcaceae bacterium]|nr:alanine--glyoxylate aminotransferase family protein [Myxococcaceae bacterium]MBH2005822.1 alanine--glyoxylate aminotransferase family protein [Myxococcaceae bacterium]